MKNCTVEKNDSMGPRGANAPAVPAARVRSAIASGSATSPAPIRVLISDKSEPLRQRICEMFAGERQFRVVGEIALPHALPPACGSLSPDIVILGLGAYGDGPYAWSALAALKQTINATTLIGTIVLVSNDTPEELLQSLRAGAKGILLNNPSKRTLLDAVGDVMAGAATLDRRLTGTLFQCLVDAAGGGPPDTPQRLNPTVLRALSPREREVLQSLAQGHRNQEIASQLGVSVGTVKTHLRHIYRKLDVSDRISAVLKALEVRVLDAA